MAGLVAAGPNCSLQDPAVGDGTSRTRRRQKSLSLPENTGQKTSFPLPRVLTLLISSTGTAGSREAFPALAAVCGAPGCQQPSPGKRCHHPGHGGVLGMATEVEVPGRVVSSSPGEDTVQVSGEKCRFTKKKKKGNSCHFQASFLWEQDIRRAETQRVL